MEQLADSHSPFLHVPTAVAMPGPRLSIQKSRLQHSIFAVDEPGHHVHSIFWCLASLENISLLSRRLTSTGALAPAFGAKKRFYVMVGHGLIDPLKAHRQVDVPRAGMSILLFYDLASTPHRGQGTGGLLNPR